MLRIRFILKRTWILGSVSWITYLDLDPAVTANPRKYYLLYFFSMKKISYIALLFMILWFWLIICYPNAEKISKEHKWTLSPIIYTSYSWLSPFTTAPWFFCLILCILCSFLKIHVLILHESRIQEYPVFLEYKDTLYFGLKAVSFIYKFA